MDEENIATLERKRRNVVPLKDFIDEARGVLDIQHYLNEASIQTSLSASSLEDAALALVPENVDDLSPEDLLKDVLFSPNGQLKMTKSNYEIGRSLVSFAYQTDLANNLPSEKNSMSKMVDDFVAKVKAEEPTEFELPDIPGVEPVPLYHLGRGLWGDIKRRARWYLSDYVDGVNNVKSVSKSISATVFLFFACLLPSIAFGSLNAGATRGAITVQKTIMAQAFGGLFFALFSGQPIVILLTTAPLALYISIIQDLADRYDYDFLSFYGAVGIMNVVFILIYVMINLSKLMKYSTRSIEEVFGLFITCAFCKDALKHISEFFDEYYYSPMINITGQSGPQNDPNTVPTSCVLSTNGSIPDSCPQIIESYDLVASRDKALLALILAIATAWFGLQITSFRKSPYLLGWMRELIADYALALSVIVFSLIGSIGFKEIKLESFGYGDLKLEFTSGIADLPGSAWGWATLLGFCLSLLFFMDQNISAALVNTPANKLKKGAAYHLDLLVVALINIPLSLFGLPWIHGALPHSPLHARALADITEKVEEGHVTETVDFVRESRISGILAHILIGFSLFAIPTPLTSIPKPVLDGLFLFLGLSGLAGSQLWERMLLIVTEQSAYPPNHYIRRVPQKSIHLFTLCQFILLVILGVIGFYPYPYLKMIFPIIILLLMPARHFVIPKIVPEKYLQAMDGAH
ncbi:Oidioi.mRNA.OKI2018_I69.PAR.g8788.t1.cds [Oikopleura dioica]|uniref:Oidioi.mRNA.OKI2018_I69.PAR.g8788.t1.cds n=1 Tax=Oikopleura dioica TaxID=34765 RepID=A0ABN7RL50_OIKDI|nr:Oidioi.mRNA.OKI2018_I69.PAR.g8788.t1.cds [Oikopleura dioica]